MIKQNRNLQAFTLVEVLIVIAIVGVLIGMLLPAVQYVREAGRRTVCLNNMRQIGLASIGFHDVHSAFPPARLHPQQFATPPFHLGDSEPSWLVRILPFLEQQNAYEQWNLSAPYESHPEDVRSQAMSVYVCPTRRTVSDANAPSNTASVFVTAPCGCGGFTDVTIVGGATGDYAGNHGDLSPGAIGAPSDYYYGGNGTGVIISSQCKSTQDGILNWIDRIDYASIRDGSSNTVLAGELHVLPENVNQIPFNGPIFNGQDLAAFARIGGPGVPLSGQSRTETSGVLGFGSWHPGICNFAFADGRTQAIENAIDTLTLGQLCNREEGQASHVTSSTN